MRTAALLAPLLLFGCASEQPKCVEFLQVFVPINGQILPLVVCKKREGETK